MGYKCSYCGNEDPDYIGFLNGKPYCRKCISFKDHEPVAHEDNIFSEYIELDLTYELTEKQRKISDLIIKNLDDGNNCFVHAVCGSGKTEIVFKVIEDFLLRGKRVGFAIPRKDVVIELCQRLKQHFIFAEIKAVYGGNKNDLDGDLIVLTTHQLYRYSDYFDLLIVDEADAFPFINNELLITAFKKSLRGNYVLMSATLENSQNIIKDNKCVTFNLFERFHGNDLPVPKIEIKCGIFKFLLLIKLMKKYLNENKPCLIFVPLIEQSQSLYELLKFFAKPGYFVNSKSKNRDEIIQKFKSGEYKYLITTMVLERGITVPNLQVIIYDANHAIFDKYSLVQISGRVGRKKEYPTGDIIYIARYVTLAMKKSIEDIKYCNEKKNEIT